MRRLGGGLRSPIAFLLFVPSLSLLIVVKRRVCVARIFRNATSTHASCNSELNCNSVNTSPKRYVKCLITKLNNNIYYLGPILVVMFVLISDGIREDGNTKINAL